MNLESKNYQRLGMLSFWIFVLQNSIAGVMGVFFFFIILVLKVAGVAGMIGPLPDGTNDLSNSIDTILNWGLFGSFALALVGIVIAFGIALIDYFGFRFVIDSHDLRIRRGIINIQETSIPYHSIENVAVERPLIYMVLGASNLIIYTAAETHTESGSYSKAEGVFPAIEKGHAEELRTELMKRANTQEIVQTNKIENPS